MKRLKTQILIVALALAVGLFSFSLPVANASNEDKNYVILWEGVVNQFWDHIPNVEQIELAGEMEVKIELVITDFSEQPIRILIVGYNRFNQWIADSIIVESNGIFKSQEQFARLHDNPNQRIQIVSQRYVDFYMVVRHRKGGGVAGGIPPSHPPPFGWRPFETALFSGILIAGFIFIVPTLILYVRFNSRKVLRARAYEKPKQIVKTIEGELKWKKEKD
jgi:hypothetical protein